jgi:hypothetical protein
MPAISVASTSDELGSSVASKPIDNSPESPGRSTSGVAEKHVGDPIETSST